MVKVGIIGATGYTGYELVRMLLQHPQVELVYLAADSTAGLAYAKVFPQLTGRINLITMKYSLEEVSKLGVELMFVAMPHGKSMAIIPELLQKGIKVIDLGADFRLTDAAAYPDWYGLAHTSPDLLSSAVYGLPEKYRERIKTAQLVANPGCYPTSVILALWPLVNAGLNPFSVYADSKSGVSGAGKKPGDATHFPQCNEALSAYKVLKHQHTPEIEQESQLPVTFVTHLVPMTRGILSTIYVQLESGVAEADLRRIYHQIYQDEPFVHLMDEDVNLSTKLVVGSNNCFLQVYSDRMKKSIVIISVLDNLIKGAAGQALQNFNIMYGFPEELGLSRVALYP